ncbi:hypothetical protein F5J12DRAFT_785133 [Pisolithus orientalis]|uniref:uncharacterized protein n=1 Tax=Pisolithus orientalis TaxID=936130 RepID=UPI002224318A|nr:uncharacterized protein F5J12DRAFT_785133 [Pisolithus orientalis]KAI5997669.1 hypothetical protein F5J12DRAFT_785133 [Pisolithus orientalis]
MASANMHENHETRHSPHAKPDKLSSEPPKEVMLKGNSCNEVRSGDGVKAEATVKVVQQVMSQGGEVEPKTMKSTEDVLCQCASPVKFKRVKSVEVEGETSGMVSENKAMKRGLGKEATDETNGQDITAKEMENLKADSGDTEIHHTSNRPEHEQLERANNERLARIVEVRVPPSIGASSYPKLREQSSKGSGMADNPSSNTKDTGGSTDALQHDTGDPGHHAHERSTHMSAQDPPISLQTPAKHPQEGVGTTAAKQHAVGEMSCKESDGHAEPKVMAEQCKCEAIEPVPDLTLQMEAHTAKNLLRMPTEHSQPKPPMTNYILESPTEQGQVLLEGEYGGNVSSYANGQNTSGKDLRDHTHKSAGSESHQCTIMKMLEVSRVSSRTVENGRDAPKVWVQPVKAENDQDSSSGHNTGSHGVKDASPPMAATQYTYENTLNRLELHSSAPGGAGLHIKQGCTLAITNETCRCQYTPEEHLKEGIGTTAVEQHTVGSSEVQEVKTL